MRKQQIELPVELIHCFCRIIEWTENSDGETPRNLWATTKQKFDTPEDFCHLHCQKSLSPLLFFYNEDLKVCDSSEVLTARSLKIRINDAFGRVRPPVDPSRSDLGFSFGYSQEHRDPPEVKPISVRPPDQIPVNPFHSIYCYFQLNGRQLRPNASQTKLFLSKDNEQQVLQCSAV